MDQFGQIYKKSQLFQSERGIDMLVLVSYQPIFWMNMLVQDSNLQTSQYILITSKIYSRSNDTFVLQMRTKKTKEKSPKPIVKPIFMEF